MSIKWYIREQKKSSNIQKKSLLKGFTIHDEMLQEYIRRVKYEYIEYKE